MAVKKEDVVGLPTGASTIQVERGPVPKFAESLQNDDPVYKNLEAAKAAGFDHIPAAPTFTFASQHWGIFEGEQPEDPTGGKGSPMRSIMGNLMANGGMILHGEQKFTYHKPVIVGQTLHHEGKVVDFYSKEAKGKTMTFVVTENVYKDDAGEPVVTERFNLIHRK